MAASKNSSTYVTRAISGTALLCTSLLPLNELFEDVHSHHKYASDSIHPRKVRNGRCRNRAIHKLIQHNMGK